MKVYSIQVITLLNSEPEMLTCCRGRTVHFLIERCSVPFAKSLGSKRGYENSLLCGTAQGSMGLHPEHLGQLALYFSGNLHSLVHVHLAANDKHSCYFQSLANDSM